jgi:tRNA pseudouridine55 synthase
MSFDFVEGEVLLINKPFEWTSFDAVNFIRSFLKRIYHFKNLKVGHAGTLDPLATGLLIICTGKKTKQIEQFMGMDKVYVGSMQLGATTPSYDRETEIDQVFDISQLTNEQIQQAAMQFLGEIDQVPPAFSAVKIDGKRAFNYARKNNEVEIKSRKVTIHNFELINIHLPAVDFAVTCSKGTYIRSLVNDFGKSLGNGAFLTELCRTKIGDFSLNDALTLEQFKQLVLDQTN